MSYDLSVAFSKWPANAVQVWKEEIKQMGAEIEFHPDFDPVNSSCYVPVAMKVNRQDSWPESDEMQDLGVFLSGFEYYYENGEAIFNANLSDGNAATKICACALASVTKGTLADPQVGAEVSSGTGMELLTRIAAYDQDYFEIVAPEEPRPFRGWDKAP